MIVPLWSTSPVHRDIVLTLQVFSVCFLDEKKKKIDGDHLIMVYTIISRSPPLSRHHAINTSLILILELLTSKTLLITTSNLLSYRRRLNTRDFKIGHYGRLGRFDAYTGGLGP